MNIIQKPSDVYSLAKSDQLELIKVRPEIIRVLEQSEDICKFAISVNPKVLCFVRQ